MEKVSKTGLLAISLPDTTGVRGDYKFVDNPPKIPL
jgi:hypothetical protein